MIHRKATLGTILLLFCLSGLQVATAQDINPESLWSDFNHYIRIARPDLASAAGRALLDQVSDQRLLDIVEASSYEDYDNTLMRAARMQEVEQAAAELAQHIREAQITRSRDPERIDTEIHKLGSGLRANLNAIDRLRAAGQYAAPNLLSVLLDDRQERMHPYVLAAMTAIGRPMVYPLSVALPHLEPVSMGQVARVLAEIGYPDTLPYLKQMLENPKTDPTANMIIQAAYDTLGEDVPIGVAAADLYMMLSLKRYETATQLSMIPDVDPDTGAGVVWRYDNQAGLVAIEVPGEIYGDVLAMQAANFALSLDDSLDPVLSLWLMANLRRENRLPEGQEDLSYPKSLHPPEFYLKMAGPERQHDVLNRALDDADPDLALDAIKALAATAGTSALLNQEGGIQPLLRAISYPDRRVRFSSAFAITNARPESEFPGSHRVVPVLAEAVRQSTVQYAIVLGKDQETLNVLKSTLQGLGFEAFGGFAIEELTDEINISPGIDLIVAAQHNADEVQELRRETGMNYKLNDVPIVAVVSLGVQVEMTRTTTSEDRITSVIRSTDQNELHSTILKALQSYTGREFSAEESSDYALNALALLREIAKRGDPVFGVDDAQPALLLALDDKRQAVVIHAGSVLSMIGNRNAQHSLADAALDVIRPIRTRIALLNSLAESASLHGNLLTTSQIDTLLNLIKTSRGDLGIAAARAHGALTLPTSHVVEMIVQ